MARRLDNISFVGGRCTLQSNSTFRDKLAMSQPLLETDDSVQGSDGRIPATVAFNLPSLYPCYLPYKVQHFVLTKVQAMLEACCFEFAKNWLPALIQEEQLECSFSVELSQWTSLLKTKLFNKIDDQAARNKYEDLLPKMRNLRDVAVHRVRTTARSISQFLRHAGEFANFLQDPRSASLIEDMKKIIDSEIYRLENKKKCLESVAYSELRDIYRGYAVLKQQEETIKIHMIESDQREKSVGGFSVQAGLEKLLSEKM